jgi:ribonuclease HII
MEALGSVYSGYSFEQHKGYGTLRHLTALTQLGPLAVHRRSFMPVLAAEQRQPELFAADQRQGTNRTHDPLLT